MPRTLLPALVCAAGLPLAAMASPVGADRAAALANTVRQDCGSCHGLTLRGGLGNPITAGALAHYDVEDLRDVILHGIPGTAMPPWQGIITSDEAEWIAKQLIEGTLE